MGDKTSTAAVKWVLLEAEAGSLRTSSEARDILKAARGDVVVNLLSIVGSARHGKSFLMNGLTGSDNVFPVSPEPIPCTAGADLSPLLMSLPDFERGDGKRTVDPCSNADCPAIAFVDMEGQGDKSPEHDVRLATPFLLVSQVSQP